MHVITRKALLDFAKQHPDAGPPLRAWYKAARNARWADMRQVRQLYPHADAATVASGNTVTVFNIGGNKYRLVTAIHYNRLKIFILRILTHKDYSRNNWKENL